MSTLLKIFSITLILGSTILHSQDEDLETALNAFRGRTIPASLLKEISVHLDNEPFEFALEDISRKGLVNLSYNRDLLPLETKVSVNLDDVYVLKALIAVMEQTSTMLQITESGALAIIPVPQTSQSEDSKAENGIIAGSIIDGMTGDILPGANIWLAGTAYGAASDINGEFVILSVPAGNYTINVSYIGYQDISEQIVVEAEQTVAKDFSLKFAGAMETETVIVTAQAKGQMKAINQQLSAREIKNVVASDRIQELPDANAAESVGRVPGVSVLRSGGEGAKVVIRGLSPKYNTVTVEGVHMASTDFDDRSSDLSMVSPYMLEGIEVLKAITPDRDADAIGGTVNFKIKEAKERPIEDGLFGYDIIARGGYNDLQSDYGDYKFVSEIDRRFLENKLGILAQLDVERRNRTSQQMGAGFEHDPNAGEPKLGQNNPVRVSSLNITDIPREKKRLGGTLVFDYRLPDGKINFKNFFSFGDTRATSYRESFIIGGDHTFSLTDSRSKLNIINNIINFDYRFHSIKIDAKLAHSLSENNAPKNMSFTFYEQQGVQSTQNRTHPTKVPDLAKNDLGNTVLRTVSEYDKKSTDKEITSALNAEIDYNFSNFISAKLKFGGKYRYKDRFYDHNQSNGYFISASGRVTKDAILEAFPWMQETTPLGSIELPYSLFFNKNDTLMQGGRAYNSDTYKDFLDGDYNLGPVADVDLLSEVLDVVKGANDLGGFAYNDYASETNDYKGNEYISAAYVMSDINIGQILKIIPGIRYEHAKTSYTAARGNSGYFDYTINYRHEDTTTVQTNAHWLPMVHVQYKPLDWFDIRFAFTNTLSRPDYRRIIPRYNISTQLDVSWHNYKLKPTKSENFDLYFSAHENYVGLFTLGLFAKNIDGLIYSSTLQNVDPAEYELQSNTEGNEIYTYINNPFKSKVIGFEIDWQTQFWYLPGLLRGFVFNANYTHIKSESKYPRTETKIIPFPFSKEYIYSYYQTRLLHQPNDIISTSLGYDYKGFSARISMLYQDDIFKGARFWPEHRSSTDDYLRWDLSLKQDLALWGLQIYCNINNISSAIDRDLNFGSMYPTAEQHYGMTLDLGLRWKN